MRKLALKLVLVTTAAVLAACGGSGSSSGGGGTTSTSTPNQPTTTPTPAAKHYTDLATRAEAARFLMQAGMGATDAQITAATGMDAAEWIATEMRKPATLTLTAMQRKFPDRFDTDRNHSDMLWQNMLTADDQLRQRMFFALSQIFVVSDNSFFDEGYKSAYYTDILTNQAFGNYRELLGEVTYSPAMSDYLTYYRNRKGDPRTGRMPDENYAREILQLFSIGLVELNMDGTPKISAGEQTETFDNDDILGLARVFTGMTGNSPDFGWSSQTEDWRHRPLVAHDDQHSMLEKAFLGTVIPENTGAEATITQALDTIANHPNVAPFLSRQLIQRFTASSPSPDYVERVATVFEAGRYTAPNGRVFGRGVRGDLQATIAAILLDETVHDDVQAPNEGKLREPVLKFVQYARAFESAPISIEAEWRFGDTRNPNDKLGQHPLRSNSVFNFYRPGYIAPNSATGDAGLTAPELQIVNEGASLGFSNFLTHFIMRRADNPENYDGFEPNF